MRGEKIHCLVIAGLIFSTLMLACASQRDFTSSDRKDTIQLKSRKIVISREEISPDFYSQLQETSLQRLHAFVQLRKRPDISTKRTLGKKGIQLLFHVEPLVWVASISKEFSTKDEMVRSLVRWIGEIFPEDKIAPDIKQGRFYEGVIAKDGRVRLSVEFFKDVLREEARGILEAYTKLLEPRGGTNGWYIVVPKDIIRKLADHDQVKWIEQGPLPFRPLNNFTRQATHAEEVQDLELGTGPRVYHGLSGTGIQVGVWDDGIDVSHEDFMLHDSAGSIIGSRLLQTNPSVGLHGTLVSGVVGASGYRSEACVAVPYIFRGMAPEVEFYVRRPWQNTVPTSPQFAEAINTYGMDVSNHSYLQSTSGRYSAIARDMDAIVRGDVDYGGATIPPRPMVWAAGNNGKWPQYPSSLVEGYFSVEAPAKNVITVGATMAGSATYPDHLEDFSSLGPTWDGRIKPELVAPGNSIRTTKLGLNCYTSGESGTSMSAPAVTGVLALILQQYAITYGVNLDQDSPYPSTLKAILIQTARDLVHDTPDGYEWNNPDTDAAVLYHEGPDYATGFGLIDAQAAVSLVKKKNLREGIISSPGEVKDYQVWVSPGAERIQFTLAWDDEPDEDTYGVETNPRLINDLELRLIAEDGSTFLPWVLDPLTPAATIGDPDPITPADITPAHSGEDHLNNVEQITVKTDVSGNWIVRVSVAPGSPGLLEEPQPYSLAGDFLKGFKVLIDASRDGGVWWFPQAGPFDPTLAHQGKAFADYLRSLGHKVDELPRPHVITPELLQNYALVIRAVGFGSYSSAEINAYTNYVQNGGRLLLLADHSASDALASSFGLQFEGITRGENKLNNYVAHPITQSVGELSYIVGSALTSYPGTAQIIGQLSNFSYLDLNNNNIQDPGEPSGPDVLGLMDFGNGRIVFCGDTNMWQSVPQPLTDNVLQWLLE